VRLLVVGKGGTTGSWRIRGEQLGAAIGAELAQATPDFSNANLVIVVKRTSMVPLIRAAGKPWVWDIVDAYPQPSGNDWGEQQAVKWLCGELERLQPNAVVFPTTAMLADSDWRGPALVLPHHAWERYRPCPIREKVETVAYEGAESYLGFWGEAIGKRCKVRGWRFQVNGDMQQADVGIAMRAQRGWPASRWKSNCKLANLQALGIPAICSRDYGYKEFGSGEEIYAETVEELDFCFDSLGDPVVRAKIGERMRATVITLNAVAAQYKSWLNTLSF
jgi:hypothetical protein